MNRASGKPAARATERLIERRVDQSQLREQARTDGIVQEKRRRTVQERVTGFKPVESKDPALKRLQDWASRDKDRVFEIHFIAAAPHPWAVDLSNDSVSWRVNENCHDTLEKATDAALIEAAKEERKR